MASLFNYNMFMDMASAGLLQTRRDVRNGGMKASLDLDLVLLYR